MAIQHVNNGEDALDARTKWNGNFLELSNLIQMVIQDTFVDTSTSTTTHTFIVGGIQSYADITNKVMSFFLPQATGLSHTFNINNYGAATVKTYDLQGAVRNVIAGEITANRVLMAYYNNGTFYLINNITDNVNAETAKTATQLANYRTFITNLASTSTGSFNGTGNVELGVKNILPIGYGGTGNNSGKAKDSEKLNGLAADSYKLGAAFRVVTGTISLTGGNGSVTLSYPSGFTFSNCEALPPAIDYLGTGIRWDHIKWAGGILDAYTTSSGITIRSSNSDNVGTSGNRPVKVMLIRKDI